ncbi:unnamed protein product, partial [Mesorhabditis spiculigera]
MRRVIFEGFSQLHYAQGRYHWEQKIASNLRSLQRFWTKLVRKPEKMPTHRTDLIDACKQYNPMGLLDVKQAIAAREAVRGIETKHFILKVAVSRASAADDLIQKLSTAAPTSLEELAQLLAQIAKPTPEPSCMLWAVVQFGRFTRKSMEAELQDVFETLKALILMGSSCNDVLNKDDPEEIEIYRQDLVASVKEIGQHAVDWAKAVQNISWPESQRALAVDWLVDKKPSTAAEAAAIVQQAYEATGAKAWEYQSLAHPGTWEPESEFAVRFVPGTYDNVTNKADWTVHVWRFNFEEENFCRRVKFAKGRLADPAVKTALERSLGYTKGWAGSAVDELFSPIGLVANDSFAGALFYMDDPMTCKEHARLGNYTLNACPKYDELGASQDATEDHMWPRHCQYRAYHLII